MQLVFSSIKQRLHRQELVQHLQNNFYSIFFENSINGADDAQSQIVTNANEPLSDVCIKLVTSSLPSSN